MIVFLSAFLLLKPDDLFFFFLQRSGLLDAIVVNTVSEYLFGFQIADSDLLLMKMLAVVLVCFHISYPLQFNLNHSKS